MTDPRQFLRGAPVEGGALTRLDRDDRRLPTDTMDAADIPAGVRLEIVGDAAAVRIRYTASPPHRLSAHCGTPVFAAWCEDERRSTHAALPGDRVAVVDLPERPSPDAPVSIYLPEALCPIVRSVTALGGEIAPAPYRPRLLAYGDSITQGWSTSEPALTWPALLSRRHHVDAWNLGFAGAARGEIAVAEQIAALPAQALVVAFGTNCWTKVPMTPDLLREVLSTFLDVLRQGHPRTPLVLVSPLLRPDAENRPNRLGATLRCLRRVVEDEASRRTASGDALRLLRGEDLLSPTDLADGIHPHDRGHRLMARRIAVELAEIPGSPLRPKGA